MTGSALPYRTLLRPLLFRLDAETAHHAAIAAGALLSPLAPLIQSVLRVEDPRLQTTVAGLDFANPLGLAAGFDKSGSAIRVLGALSFGHVEIGSVSLDPSMGNPKPRLWRLPEDEAIAVHYGLPNDGARIVAERVAATKRLTPLGINIVKTNRGPGAPPETREEIIAEYAEAARLLAPLADYLMLNLSCPNTEDGRDFFADAQRLRDFLQSFAALRLPLPVFLKLSPLGGAEAIERVLAAAEPHRFIAGFMFNLAPVKPEGLRTPETIWRGLPGAISGPPSAPLADRCLSEMYRRMDRKRYALLYAGGVRTAEEAYAKLKAGASLVQLYTALIYEGPGVVNRILRGLLRLMDRDGVKRIAEVIGADAT